MFSLPQPALPQSECDSGERLSVLDVAEPAAVLDPLLRFLYPVPDPEVSTLDINLMAERERERVKNREEIIHMLLYNIIYIVAICKNLKSCA